MILIVALFFGLCLLLIGALIAMVLWGRPATSRDDAPRFGGVIDLDGGNGDGGGDGGGGGD